MITSIKISPFALQLATTAVIGEVKVNIELAEVSIPVTLLDAAGTTIGIKHVKLTGEDYDNWKNDDSYLIAKAFEKLGIFGEGGAFKVATNITSLPAADINPPNDGKQSIAKKAVAKKK